MQYASEGGSTYLKRVYLTRQPPAEPDIVAWTLEESVEPEDGYQMNSFISRATKEDLRAAGTDYGGFIRDHYLQLPESLPQRVRDLAAEVTRDAETPLDKAFAVRDYLRGDAFTYSRDIEKPPRGADAVDHFLFEAKEGYGDYFSSAMTVMLRAVGVPARLAAGYAAGEIPEGGGRRAVRDSDSHGWTQVYFPEYGWIDFEPTPKWPEAGAVYLDFRHRPGRWGGRTQANAVRLPRTGRRDRRHGVHPPLPARRARGAASRLRPGDRPLRGDRADCTFAADTELRRRLVRPRSQGDRRRRPRRRRADGDRPDGPGRMARVVVGTGARSR